jgi:hypothetical protein
MITAALNGVKQRGLAAAAARGKGARAAASDKKNRRDCRSSPDGSFSSGLWFEGQSAMIMPSPHMTTTTSIMPSVRL